MRFTQLCIIAPVWAVLATVGCAPAVHSTSNQPDVNRVAGSPIPGAPEGITAFVDVSVVPMDTETVLSDQTVLVQGGRIVAMGPASQVQVPSGAVRIDSRGKFLLPGLADMHAHLFPGTHMANLPLSFSRSHRLIPYYAPETDSAGAQERLFMWLANGVTTVRDLDYFDKKWGRQALEFRALAAAGKSWIPHIYTAGPWGPPQYIGLFHGNESENKGPPVLDSIPAYVAAYKAAGYDLIKIHEESPAVLDAVLAAAKRVGIPVAGHVPRLSTMEHVLWGYKSIEHPLADYQWKEGHDRTDISDTAGIGVLAATMARTGVWNCPTQQHYDRLHEGTPNTLKVEQDAGVKLLLGSDEFPWLGVITRELQAMVSAGLTPYQALLTGTRNVAVYFGTLDQSGTITVGKRADMVLLTGNPLQDVRYTAQPAGVMLGGRWLPREEIQRRLATLTMLTFTNGDSTARNLPVVNLPVKSYWSNVVDQARETMAPTFYSITLDDTQKTKYGVLKTAHKAQREALIDSLGASDQYTAGTQRVLRLVAQQLGDYHLILTPEQRAKFDPAAGEWIQRYKKEGYSADIPGVQ